jgi:subtilisin-like proprotein convertase family protein/transcriptional regulator CtsR
VFGGTLSVHVGSDLTIRSVNQDLEPISERVGIVAPKDPTGAIRAAVAAVNAADGPTKRPAATAGVFMQKGTPVVAWRITFDTHSPPGAWEVLVAARNGTVLSLRNMAREVEGSGLVFNPNPVQSSGNAALADSDDADSATLNDQRVSVTLRNLEGNGRLQGTFCSTAPTSTQARANEPTNTFNYTRNDDRFEEVMSYYWITETQRYIQSLGFTNVNNRVQGMDVNGIPNDNSFYSPGTGDITMGSGGVDDAEDGDVILHEYGHSIQDNQVPGWGATEEGGAMGEGFGDYWAGSHGAAIGGPQSPAWDVFVAKWDAVSYNPGSPAFLRPLNSTKHYPEGLTGEVHDDGEIWSACLWQVRGLVGRTRADTMILEAHFAVSPEGGFEDGANAILEANEALYAGADRSNLRKIFRDRGILSEPTRFNITGQVTASSGLAGVEVRATGPAIAELERGSVPFIPIRDNSTIEDTLEITNTSTIVAVSVGVDITHTYLGDLRVSLVHPDGTAVVLHNQGGSFAGGIHTIYPEQTTPAQPLGVLAGKPLNGTWKLRVQDFAALDEGSLEQWTLTLRYPEGQTTLTTTTDAQGRYGFTNLIPGRWTVEPRSATLNFVPASRAVTLGPDQTGIDFQADANVPTNLTATAVSQTAIALRWRDNSSAETGFKLERRKGTGSYAQIATPATNATSYTDETGLVANTAYTYRLRAVLAGGHSGYSNEATATTLAATPTAPSALTATAVSRSAIHLQWRDNSTTETGFKLERRKEAGSYAQIATPAANATTYSDTTGLVANTEYTYRVRASSAGGDSAFSNEASATTLPTPPTAPSALKAVAQSQTQIHLQWRDNSTNESSFKLERRKGAGSYAQIATPAANATTYNDATGLVANSEYTYRVRASNTGGDSAYSNEAAATTLPNPPTAPSALTATAVSQTAIALRWRDNSTTETGFKLERRKGVGSYAQIATPAVNATTYSDTTGLVVNTTYSYRVRAFNTGGNSAYSNEGTATTLPTLPAAPSTLTAVAQSPAQINLRWRDNSTNESGFKLERRKGVGSYVQIAALIAGAITYSDATGLVANSAYTYRVRAFNAGGNSAYSNEATATTLPTPPAAPSSLTAALASDVAIDLQWRDNSNNESGFKLERKVGNGAFGLLTVAAANAIRFRDGGLAPNTLYTYRVRAFNAGGESATSNEAGATTPRKLGGILVVTPTSINFKKVKVKKTKLATVTLRNASTTERLRVTVTPPAAPFGLPTPPGTAELAPGGTVAVSVSFRPTKKKKYTGKLALTSSDPAHAAVSVSLKGAGK